MNIGENSQALKICQNGCTKEIEIHPVRSDVWHTYPVDADDNTKENYGTLIMDKRNKWLKKHCTQYSFQPLIADSPCYIR